MLDELSTLHDQFIELSKCLQYGKKEIPCEEVNQIIVTYKIAKQKMTESAGELLHKICW